MTPISQQARSLFDRALASSWLHRTLIVVYLLTTLIVLAPVLASSVSADDAFWVMEVTPDADGSPWQAFWSPVSQSFAFEGQPRTTSLALGERRVLALITMKLAVTFAIPPAVIWAAVKIALFALGPIAAVVFMRHLRFRDTRGTIRTVQPASIAFIALGLPLTMALGAKSQDIGTLNGWNHYPTLTYGPFVAFLLLITMVLKSSGLLQRNYRRWLVPVVSVMAVTALTINLSYEVLALTIPLCAILLLLQPMPDTGTPWERWRSKVTVLLALGGTYTMIFGWIRWRISEMACYATDTCYPGSVPEHNAQTLWNNLIGAAPGRTEAFVRDQAESSGREIPHAGSVSIAVAILGAITLLGLWAGWTARRSATAPEADDSAAHEEARGLLIIIATGLLIAIGAAVITGMTARAVDMVRTPMLPYRTGVVTWSALALSGLAGIRLLLITRWRAVGVAAVAALIAMVVGSISVNLPRNLLSTQENRANPSTMLYNTMHWEVAQGDISDRADARRCASIRPHVAIPEKITPQYLRAITAAYASFEFFHHRPYCSTGEGLKNQ